MNPTQKKKVYGACAYVWGCDDATFLVQEPKKKFESQKYVPRATKITPSSTNMSTFFWGKNVFALLR
jgi:hypothetical protein